MERYKPIIDDWEAFQEACQKPIVSTVRKNSIKAEDNFEERLRQSFENVEQVDWKPNMCRLPETETPGKSMLHWMGEYYVQEESAAIPVTILDPEEGDRILDMAAAPGGKTTQIASMIENNGVVIANDESGNRMKSLHANVYRTGAACVAATNYDGRQIPEDEEYDKILVDAPCSGEADRARRGEKASLGEIKGLAELQKQLAVKASRLLKEGGTMVYSTCTFAPEENEEVVKHVLEETDLELERAETGANHVRGVTEFEDREYGEEMTKTIRVYPHHLDSGGIYIAKFVKPEDSLEQVERRSSESSISSNSETDVEEAWNYISERFGVERSDLEGFHIKKVAGDYWLISEQLDTQLEVETYGFRFVRITGRGLKPTTYALQFLRDRISKNIVELDREEFLNLLRRNEMVDREMENKGYTALKYEGQIVGCGYYMNQKVSSRIPKGRGKELADILQ